MTDEDNYLVRCTTCNYARLKPQEKAYMTQKRHTCPTCDRGLAVADAKHATEEQLQRARTQEGKNIVTARAD